VDSISELIKQINKLQPRDVNYIPYNLKKDTIITYGTPPVPIVGLESFSATYLQPRSKLVMCLTGKGVFVSNQNRSGLIELVLLSGSVSCGAIQALEAVGIPMPLGAIDNKSAGTSFMLGSACRLIQTPPWRRAARPDRVVFTFHTPRLIVSTGIRLQLSA